MALPPGVPVDPTDVAWRRCAAAAIDVGMGAVIGLVLFVLLSEDTYRFDTGSDAIVVSRELSGAGAVLFYGAWLAYNVGVFVLQRGLTGRTLGTMALGIATVGSDGLPLGAPRALLRSVAGIVDYLPCCLPLVGIITTFTTPNHRRVGDMAASSVVIDARWAGSPVPAPGSTTSAIPPAAAPTPAPMAGGWSSAPPPPLTPSPGIAPGDPARPLWSDPSPTSPPPAPSPTAAPVPQWEPARQAYVAWDPRRRQWLQFDQASQQWLQYDAVTALWRPVASGPRPGAPPGPTP